MNTNTDIITATDADRCCRITLTGELTVDYTTVATGVTGVTTTITFKTPSEVGAFWLAFVLP